MIGSFVFMNPLFLCNGHETTEPIACTILEQCEITNSFTATVYDSLICEREMLREWIQVSVFIGTCVGPFLAPAVSDYIGRKKASLAALGTGFVGSLLLLMGICENWKGLMILGNFLLGINASALPVLTYIYSTELFG